MSSRENPILMSAPMVRAILAGKKTQTRRIFFCDNAGPNGAGEIVYGRRGGGFAAWDGETTADGWPLGARLGTSELQPMPCPHGKPWDRLWVREAWALEELDEGERVVWRADRQAHWLNSVSNPFCLESSYEPERWRPSIHMPRWASRIDLEITAVRCERLQDITEVDARAEGVDKGPASPLYSGIASCREGFAKLWDEINGERAPWTSNPWVWAISFKRVRP